MVEFFVGNYKKGVSTAQDYTTILGIIEMCQRGISYDNCCGRYNVGHSTITRIMSRYEELGRGLETLKQLAPAEVEKAFYPPENIRRKVTFVLSAQFA